MSQIFALFCHYLFWQRIMRFFFGAGVLMFSAGAVWYAVGEPDPLKQLPIVIGLIMMLGIPMFLAVIAFRQLVSNARLALVPALRQKAGLALLLLTVVVSLLCMLITAITKTGFQPRVFTLSFASITAYLLLGQWLLSRRWGTFVLWLFLVFNSQIWQLPAVHAVASNPESDGILLLLAAAGWIATLRWLAIARRIPPMRFNFSQTSESNGISQAQVAPGMFRLSFAGTLSPFNTLLRGGYHNWRNRLSTQLLLFAGFPLMMSALMVLPGWVKGRPLTGDEFNPNVMLGYGLYGSLLGCFFAREWLARMRYLWLRAPGNRGHLWQRLEQLLLSDMKLSVTVAASYAGIIWLVSDLPAERAFWFTAISAAVLVFCSYFALYQRVRQLHIAFSIITVIGAIGLVAAAVLSAHFLETRWPVVAVVLALPVGSLILRQLTSKLFLQVDWSQIRPTVIGRLGSAGGN